MTVAHPDQPVIVFDALCVLCAANARFVLKHDRRRRFHLASMQGPLGAALYREHGIDPAAPDTLLVVDGARVLRDSDAVLATAVLRLIPRALRDPVYRWVARNRYRIFGRRETCWLPSPEDRDRVS